MKKTIFWFTPVEMARVFLTCGWIIIASFYTLGQNQPMVKTDLSLLSVADGKPQNLGPLIQNEYAVILFTSAQCIYDGYYDTRIRELAQNWGPKGVSFIAVDPTTRADQAKMTHRAKKLKSEMNIVYLWDVDQAAREAFGAMKTPEAFFIRKKAGGLQIIYHGAIDNNPQAAEDVKDRYLHEAISNTLEGQGSSISKKNAIGCVIR